MKIVHLYKDYFPVLGGIENHIRVLAEAQACRGHQVTVLATSATRRTERYTFNGVKVIKAARLAAPASTPISLVFFQVAASLKADIVHLHFPYPPGEVANLLFKVGQRTVITYHSDVVRQKIILRLYRPLLGRVLRAADRILPTSQAYLETSPHLQTVRSQCTVLPLGVDLDRFAHPAPGDVAALRSLINPKPDEVLLLFVGRLRHYKGLDVLLQSIKRLDHTRLVVVGEGPMKPAWQSLSVALGVGERVHFVGEVEEAVLPAWYALADIFVLPATSRAEAFGTVILEAMAAGKPVISTEVGTGTSWVNQDGITGLVVPGGDALALEQAIARLSADERARKEMGAKALERVEAEFSQAKMIERVEAVYKELLTKV